METSSEYDDERLTCKNSLAPMMFSTALGEAFLPSRGLLYSLLGHGFLALALICVPQSYWLHGGVRVITAGAMVQERQVLLLPRLEPTGGRVHKAKVTLASKGGNKHDLASQFSAKAIRGVVYRGPQLLVSNPPHPDNYIQSIRQPDLAVKPKLPAPLPLPPMVLLAQAKPLLAPQPALDNTQKSPVKIAAIEPIKLPEEAPIVAAPKLPIPVTGTTNSLLDPATPVSIPKLARNLLVMDAIPTVNHKPSIVPPGETHGAFTVSPTGVADLGSAGGGTEPTGAPGIANASGNSTGQFAGIGTKTDRVGAGSGIDAGQHSTTGTNGTSRPSVHVSRGGGVGTGSGNSPFPSIMIQGGSSGRGESIVTRSAAKSSKPQTAYGITILANGSSGGGFKDFGIFRDEASYTVYLDMEDASSWALQYALESHRGQDLSVSSHTGPLVPPYATSKSLPHFPPDALRRSMAGAIVVFGIISTHGEFEGLRIMHSPEPRLDQFLLASLRKWRFRPAQIDGTQVAVKVLLGVPINPVIRE